MRKIILTVATAMVLSTIPAIAQRTSMSTLKEGKIATYGDITWKVYRNITGSDTSIYVGIYFLDPRYTMLKTMESWEVYSKDVLQEFLDDLDTLIKEQPIEDLLIQKPDYTLQVIAKTTLMQFKGIRVYPPKENYYFFMKYGQAEKFITEMSQITPIMK